MTERDRVFVDANELFPFSVMDLVLAVAEDLLIDFVWTRRTARGVGARDRPRGQTHA